MCFFISTCDFGGNFDLIVSKAALHIANLFLVFPYLYRNGFVYSLIVQHVIIIIMVRKRDNQQTRRANRAAGNLTPPPVQLPRNLQAVALPPPQEDNVEPDAVPSPPPVVPPINGRRGLGIRRRRVFRRRTHAQRRSNCHTRGRVKTVFGFKPVNSKQTIFLYDLIKGTREAGDSVVTLISNRIETLPFKFECLLYLGLNFCLPSALHKKQFAWHLKSSLRRLSWHIFFKRNPSNNSARFIPYKIWLSIIKRFYAKKTKVQLTPDRDFDSNFDLVTLMKDISSSTRRDFRYTPEWCINKVSREFSEFLRNNNLAVVEADKNGGVCIVDADIYDQRVFAFLHNNEIYNEVTQNHVEDELRLYKGRFEVLYRSLLSRYTMPNQPINFPPFFNEIPLKAASFYGLLKTHKEYQNNFPPIRPIASTINKTNRAAASLLHYVLAPCIHDITDLVLDSSHFILVLEKLQLQKHKTYALVTLDIESMYTNLLLQDCKNYCYSMYRYSIYRNPCQLSENQFKTLLNLALDYSYVKYKNSYFKQKKGLEMGNIASPIIANITIFCMLHDIINNNKAIVFHKRHLDDLFLIVDTTNIRNVKDWIKHHFQSATLTFTSQINFISLPFLDVTVTLNSDNNSLTTSNYRRPMNRKLPLHTSSNHTNLLKKGLFFSQGMRIVRHCSRPLDRVDKLTDLKNQYLERGYPKEKIQNDFIKLNHFDRNEALRPRNATLMEYLRRNELEIATHYNLPEYVFHFPNFEIVRVVVPHSNQVPHMNRIVRQGIDKQLKERVEEALVSELKYTVSNSRVKNLKEYFYQ